MTQFEPSYGGRPTIKPFGSENPAIYIVGDFPTSHDSTTRKPFSSNMDQTIISSLEREGVSKSEIRIGYTCWVEPANSYTIHSVSQYGIASNHFHLALIEDIATYKPKAILGVGPESLKFLCGKSQLDKWRGSPLHYIYDDTILVIPTLKMSDVMKGRFPLTIAVRSDCRKAVMLARGNSKIRDRKFLNFSRGATFSDFRRELIRLKHLEGFLAYDIEGWYPKLDCISFSDHPNRAVSVPLNGTFNEDDEFELFRLVKEVLENPLSFKVAHNMMFDNDVLAKYGIGVRNIFMDTMTAHHTVYTEDGKKLPHSLAFCTSMYTWEPYYKDDRSMVGLVGSKLEADDYSCRDSAVTIEIVGPILRELKAYGLTEYYFTTMMDKIKSASEIQSHGLFTDQKAKEELIEETNVKMHTLEEALLTTYGINPHSATQVKKLLYEDLKFTKQYKDVKQKDGTRKRTVTAEKKALIKLIMKYPQEQDLFVTLIKVKSFRHDLSHYLLATPGVLDEPDRLYYSTNITGSVSGRYSIGKVIDKTGVAAHGIPPHMRVIVIPPYDDCILWSCDAKQAESMYVTWVAEEQVLFDAFMDGIDTHQIIGSQIFHLPPEQIIGELRDVSKVIRHGTNYWMGPKTLQNEVLFKFPEFAFSYQDAKNAIKTIRSANPSTYAWGKYIEDAIYRGVRLFKNCYGKHRMLIGPASQDMIRSAISFDPQSSVSDMVAIASGEVIKKLRKYKNLNQRKNYIDLTKHDELKGVCEKCNVMLFKELVQEEMERPLPGIEFNNVPLSIPSEFSIGENWRDMEEIEE